jgi:hypothetical protein
MKIKLLIATIALSCSALLTVKAATEYKEFEYRTDRTDMTVEELSVLSMAFNIIKIKEKLKYDKKDIKQTSLNRDSLICENEYFLQTTKTLLDERFFQNVLSACDIIQNYN